MLEWLDSECDAAVARVMRNVRRRLSHEARSKGQKARREREARELVAKYPGEVGRLDTGIIFIHPSQAHDLTHQPSGG